MTLLWARVFELVIALLAALASSVRTIQTASEIYAVGGSHPLGVALAAIAFTFSVEGALFVLGLASEGERLRQKAQNKPRHVRSLRGLWRGLLVRIGLEEPEPYQTYADHGGLVTVMVIAFLFAVAANAYMGLRPLLTQIGAVSLQAFLASLWSAPANLQLTFVVDMAAVLFPPLMALKAGHLTARFAAEIAEKSQTETAAYEQDVAAWREAYASPLDTPEGREVLDRYLRDKLRLKTARKANQRPPEGASGPFLALTSPNGREDD